MSDFLILEELKLSAVNGVDGWERTKAQPLILSLKLGLDIASNDQIELNYSTVAKQVGEFTSNSQYKSMEELADGIADLCLQKAKWVQVRLEKPKALLHADAAGVLINRPMTHQEPDQLYISNLQVNAILGINPWERESKQKIILSLNIYDMANSFSYRTIARVLDEYVQGSSFKTVEALVSEVARVAVEDCGVGKITVKLEKPSALLFAKGIYFTYEITAAGVQITRDISYYQKKNLNILDHTQNIAYLALGSNQGDRIGAIEDALDMLESEKVKILDTSFLYETLPMYVSDQPRFLNAVIKVSTSLKPQELLDLLKRIESSLGRDLNGIRNGPRIIDLDILFFNDVEISTDELTIPHPRLQEREFVLRPLCE